jgi:hypothetical protein
MASPALSSKKRGTIKGDVMQVINLFGDLQVAGQQCTFAKKRMRRKKFQNLEPLVTIAKIITKILARRLGMLMNDLVSNTQNAFIKRRNIHDNFIMLRTLQRNLNKQNHALLFKLDIRKHLTQLDGNIFLAFSIVDSTIGFFPCSRPRPPASFSMVFGNAIISHCYSSSS